MALIIITGGGPLIIAVGTGIKFYSPVLNSSRDIARSELLNARIKIFVQLSLFSYESRVQKREGIDDSCLIDREYRKRYIILLESGNGGKNA